MTYLDRALLNNPHMGPTEIIFGMCPSDINFDDPECDALCSGVPAPRDVCKACWERQMPKEKEHPRGCSELPRV